MNPRHNPDSRVRRAVFRTTQWEDILAMQTEDPDRRHDAVSVIAEAYWQPVYSYLRRLGKRSEDARDLAQGFFEATIRRESFLQADPHKGRFRTFLLAMLNRFVASTARAEMALKRMPRSGLISLEGLESPNLPEPSDQLTPEQAFLHSWAVQLLDDVIAEVQAGCQHAGQKKHWEVFQRTVLDPILTGTPAPSLAEICEDLGIENEKKAANMKVTVKRRFRSAMMERIRLSAASDQEAEEELQDLIKILAHRGAA